MAVLKKVFGSDITYLFDGSYQQLYATMIYFPLGEQLAKLFAEVDSNSNSDVIMWNKPYDGNMGYNCVETSPEKDVLLMLWSKREKELRERLTLANVPDIDKLLTFPDYSYLFYTINENADDDVPEKKYNFVLCGWGCQKGIEIHRGSDNTSQQKREAENKHQEVLVHLLNENGKPICNQDFKYTYQNGLTHSVNSNDGKVELGLCLIGSEFTFTDTQSSLNSSFRVVKGQLEYTLTFIPPVEEPTVEKPIIEVPVKEEPIIGPKPKVPAEGPTPEELVVETHIIKVVTESLLPIPFYSLVISRDHDKHERISNEDGIIILPKEWTMPCKFEVFDNISGKLEEYSISEDLEYVFIVPDKKPMQTVFVRVVNQKGDPIPAFSLTIQFNNSIVDIITDEYGVHALGELKVDDEFFVACTEAKHINQKFVVEQGKDEYIFQIEEELSPITLTLLNKKEIPIPSASMTITNTKGENYSHYTDDKGEIRVVRSYFTDQERINVHVELTNATIKDCKFKYEEKFDHYNIIIKDPFPWKKLWRLLLLLLLLGLFFVRCNKDVTIKVVEPNKTPVAGALVEMEYTEHQLYKNGTFFYSAVHVIDSITGFDGSVTFTKQPCSVFSWVLYTLSKADVMASKNGHSGTGSFIFHWRFTPYIIILNKDINIRVVDGRNSKPICGAKVQLWSDDLNMQGVTLTTGQNGWCTFVTNKTNANIDKILATAGGYSGSLLYNISLNQADSLDIILELPASCDQEVNNRDNKQGDHAIYDFYMGQKEGDFLFEYFTDSYPDHIMIYDGTSSDYANGSASMIFEFDGATNTTTLSESEIVHFSSSYICVVVDNGSNWGYYVHCPQ